MRGDIPMIGLWIDAMGRYLSKDCWERLLQEVYSLILKGQMELARVGWQDKHLWCWESAQSPTRECLSPKERQEVRKIACGLSWRQLQCVCVCMCVCVCVRERETEQWGRGGWKERIGEFLDIGKSWAVGRFFCPLLRQHEVVGDRHWWPTSIFKLL